MPINTREQLYKQVSDGKIIPSMISERVIESYDANGKLIVSIECTVCLANGEITRYTKTIADNEFKPTLIKAKD